MVPAKDFLAGDTAPIRDLEQFNNVNPALSRANERYCMPKFNRFCILNSAPREEKMMLPESISSNCRRDSKASALDTVLARGAWNWLQREGSPSSHAARSTGRIHERMDLNE
jgi:hypothetical protein